MVDPDTYSLEIGVRKLSDPMCKICPSNWGSFPEGSGLKDHSLKKQLYITFINRSNSG